MKYKTRSETKRFPMKQINNNGRKYKEIDGKVAIFDYLRKKYVILTPEEEVRQGIVDFLIFEKKYPKTLIKLETGLNYNSLNKRSDILVYDNKATAFLLIECKAKDIKIDQKVIEQATRYNLMLNARYVCVTNGETTFCFEKLENGYAQLNTFPDFTAH